MPNSLKIFYQTFGVADIGEELQNFKDIDWIKNIWSNPLQYAPDFSQEDKTHLPFLVSFSDYLGNGNMFCFHSKTKEIYYFDHDHKPYITKMFKTVDEYLKCCLIFAQLHLFGNVEQEIVEEWTEEIVCTFVDKKIVEKWRY